MQDDLTKMAEDANQEDKFYAPDLNAQVLAENNMNDDLLGDTSAEEDPVTSDDMVIGDLDANNNAGGSEDSKDEEAEAGGEDNTVPED